MDRRITPEQWVLHLDAAEQAGVPLSAYARDNGLNVQHLYAARQRQRRLAARQAGNALDAPQPSAFATVQVKPSAIALVAKLSATLPNGVVFEFNFSVSDTKLVGTVIGTLARTPCSVSTRR
ncbi:IS66 family insertion sequence element accessory protein TnpA [Paraburkholderia aspalathi]|uniref:IS66 family insertion sequence element accessory protein TnpA n=1 Tax=Paraburkholderia aspalathi TaxID=1324617 RepID=UPI0038BCB166